MGAREQKSGGLSSQTRHVVGGTLTPTLELGALVGLKDGASTSTVLMGNHAWGVLIPTPDTGVMRGVLLGKFSRRKVLPTCVWEGVVPPTRGHVKAQ